MEENHRSAGGWHPVLLACLLFSAALVSPQAGSQERHAKKWWQSPDYVAKLGLTSEQVAQLEAIFQSSLPELRATKADLDRAEQQLSQLIGAPATQEADVLRQIDIVERARSALSKARTLMLFRMHRVLNSDQRAKLKALQSHGSSSPSERGQRPPSEPRRHF